MFTTHSGEITAVDGVSFKLARNETLGIVGESGCGKSVTARSILRLVEFEGGRIDAGSIIYHPTAQESLDLSSIGYKSPLLRDIRGVKIAMIFQEPMASFNPVFPIGRQLAEVLMYHLKLSKVEARERVIEMLDKVKIPNASRRFDEYPHEFSGGMRQRAMIAMALLCNPSILIADEPTTALDVTVEAQILELINILKAESQMTTIIITHDMAVVGEMTDNVMVMYVGRMTEYAASSSLFTNPLHPYTQALLKSIPTIGCKDELYSIEGTVPSLLDLPGGCYFAPRCRHAMERCRKEAPPVFEPEAGHKACCWLYAGQSEGDHNAS